MMHHNEEVIRVLRHPVYRRLFLAQVVALAGTGIATVALGLLSYRLAGARAGEILGTILAIKMIAYVLVAPIAAAVVARFPRRAVMIGSDLLRASVALTLPFVGELWQIYLLVFVLQAASATFTPLFQSVIPDVLPDENDYTTALSLSRLAYDLEAVLSPVLTAVLLLVVPAPLLFLGTALGFAGSAVLVRSVHLPLVGRRSTGTFVRRVRRGIVLFGRTPALRPILALNLAVAGVGSFVLVQTVVVVRDLLHRDEGQVALLLAANGAGSMVAAILLPRLLRRWTERRLMLGGAVVLTTGGAVLPLLLTGSAWTWWAIAALWAVLGLGWSAVQTPVGRIVARSVAEPDRPTVFAAQFSLSHAGWLLTYPLVGWLGATDLRVAAIAAMAITAAATTVAAVLWPREPTRREEGQAVEAETMGAMTQDPDDRLVDSAVDMMRLLADRTRLSILTLLVDEELSVGSIATRLDRPMPAISQHLSRLRAGQLVKTRKDGTTVLYSLTNGHVATLVQNVLQHTEHVLYDVPPHHRS